VNFVEHKEIVSHVKPDFLYVLKSIDIGGGGDSVDSLFNNPPPNKSNAVGAGYLLSKMKFMNYTFMDVEYAI
jgi:hypothetical protein